MSVRLISGPWEPGNNSERARKEAHVTRNVAPANDTRYTVSKRLVDSLSPAYYIDNDSTAVLSPREPFPSECSTSVIAGSEDVEGLRDILETCRRAKIRQPKSEVLQDIQKKLSSSLNRSPLCEWSDSTVDWGLLPKRTYQLIPRPKSEKKPSPGLKLDSKQPSQSKLHVQQTGRPNSERNSALRPKRQTSLSSSSVRDASRSQERHDVTNKGQSDADPNIVYVDDEEQELPVHLHQLLGSLQREYSQYQTQRVHSATRIRVIDECHNSSGVAAPIGSLVLKEARRYRRPYHSAANLPVTVSKDAYKSAMLNRSQESGSKHHGKKVYTPMERALERNSASYESQMRRAKNKEVALATRECFRVKDASPRRSMSLPRLSADKYTRFGDDKSLRSKDKYSRSVSSETNAMKMSEHHNEEYVPFAAHDDNQPTNLEAWEAQYSPRHANIRIEIEPAYDD